MESTTRTSAAHRRLSRHSAIFASSLRVSTRTLSAARAATSSSIISVPRRDGFYESGDVVAPAEARVHALLPCRNQPLAKEPVGRRLPDRSGKVFRAAGREVERGLPANLAVDLGICGYDGKAIGHRLDEGITKGLNQRGRNEDIGVLIEF